MAETILHSSGVEQKGERAAHTHQPRTTLTLAKDEKDGRAFAFISNHQEHIQPVITTARAELLRQGCCSSKCDLLPPK